MVILIVDRAVSRAIHFFSARTSKHVQYFRYLHQFDRLVSRPIFFFSTFFIFFFSLVVCLFVYSFFVWVQNVSRGWKRAGGVERRFGSFCRRRRTRPEEGREGNCGKPEYGFQQQQQQHVEIGGDAVNFSLPPLRTVSNLQTVRKEVRGDRYNRTN